MGIGYQGYMKVGGIDVLGTGGGVGLVQDPITSGAAWGAGWKTVGIAHYADYIERYEGTLDFELHAGVWSVFDPWVVTNRITAKSVVVSPDGSGIQTYSDAYNTSCGFSTSEGSFVTVSVGVMAFTRTSSTGSTYVGNVTGTGTAVPYLTPNLNPIPFWKTTAAVGGVSGDATEWSIDVSQNTLVLYTCRNSKAPKAILQGTPDASGSVGIFNDAGVGDVALATMSSLSVVITGAGTISIPNAWVESDDYSVQGGDSIISKTFSVKGFVDGTQSCIKFT